MKLIELAERGHVPDWLIRVGIRQLLAERLRSEYRDQPERQEQRYREVLQTLNQSVIAEATDAANEQHYEVPAAFYDLVLGPHRKYSSALYKNGVQTLGEAEAAMLALVGQRARLENGQRILELGCGWGSLTLWMARQYPEARITGLSNSASQREKILQEASSQGLDNVDIVTADINQFSSSERYDRVVSVEMFEHVRNYRQLMSRIAGWLRPKGYLFVHIFCHRFLMYPFEEEGEGDWMARHFFTGGMMPAMDTLLHFQQDMEIDQRWAVNGRHYQQTSEAWLSNLDQQREAALAVLGQNGSTPPHIQLQRWRLFFMACAELFGYAGGSEWLVGHYRFRPRSSVAPGPDQP